MSNKHEPPRCLNNGYLVNARREIPTDKTIYYAGREQPLIGCNRICCGNCQCFVRNWPGYRLAGRLKWATLSQDELHRLYTTKQPELLPFLSAEYADRSRVYACMCHAEEISGSVDMTVRLWIMDRFDFEHWGCAGHPQ